MHKIINEFINKMNESTSTNDKVDLIKDYIYKHKEIQKLLYYTYNSFMQYNVTPKVLDKKSILINKHTIFQKDKDLFSLLDSLNQKMFTGHNAIKEVNGFIHHNKQLKDILYLVLNRNLKIRVSSKLVNKASPGLIPEFNVALANKYDEKSKKKISFQNDTWFISRKLDGVRCIIVVDEKGKAKSFSRAGKQFHTLSLVEKEIESLGIKNVVYDGEMCIVDDNNNEDFQSIMKEISRKNHTITNGLFQVFDFIPYRMFSKGYGEAGNLSQRLTTLQTLLINKPLLYLDYLEHTPITSFEELHKLRDIAIQKGWEGLMLRKNTVYKGKRSNDILKVKTFYDSEYRVEEANFGPFRYVKEGKEVEEDMLTAVTIKHKGNTVRVGSGFSIEQRQHFFKVPSDIVGKEITVQYFEESQNQNGNYSLRFPVIKAIYENGRNA